MHVRLLFFSAAIFVAAPLFGATISATTTGDGTASGNFFFYLSSAGVSFDAGTAASEAGGTVPSTASITISQEFLTAGPVRPGLAEFTQNDNTQVRGSSSATILNSLGGSCANGQACFVTEWLPVTLGEIFTFSTTAEASAGISDFAIASGSDWFLFYEADGSTPVDVFDPTPEPGTWSLAIITFGCVLLAARFRLRRHFVSGFGASR